MRGALFQTAAVEVGAVGMATVLASSLLDIPNSTYYIYPPPPSLPPSPTPSYLLVCFLMTNRFHGDHRGRSDSGDGDGDLAIQTVGYQEIDEKTNFRIAAEIDLCTRESLHEVRGRGEEGQGRRERGGGRGGGRRGEAVEEGEGEQ